MLANRFIYHFSDPRRGEIVVFDTPPEALQACGAGGTFVKRLVGLPGETIEQRDGVVYINGEPLDEPYLEPDREGGEDYGPQKIPDDAVLHDGRQPPGVLRQPALGPVPRENLIGEVFAVYWPPQRIGFR